MRRIPDETRDAVYRAWMDGLNTIELAAQFSISQPAVSKILREHGKTVGSRLHEQTLQTILTLGRPRTLSANEIGRSVGVNGHSVANILRRHGIAPLTRSEARRTHSGPWAGKTMPAEMRAKFRAAKLGKAQSAETVAKRSVIMKERAARGPAHYLWRGGITPEQKKQRNTPEYRAWRTAVYERDDYTCQMCGQRGGKLQPDHIKAWCEYPELRYDVANGRTLCVPCHRKTPTYGVNLLRRSTRSPRP